MTNLQAKAKMNLYEKRRAKIKLKKYKSRIANKWIKCHNIFIAMRGG